MISLEGGEEVVEVTERQVERDGRKDCRARPSVRQPRRGTSHFGYRYPVVPDGEGSRGGNPEATYRGRHHHDGKPQHR